MTEIYQRLKQTCGNSLMNVILMGLSLGEADRLKLMTPPTYQAPAMFSALESGRAFCLVRYSSIKTASLVVCASLLWLT